MGRTRQKATDETQMKHRWPLSVSICVSSVVSAVCFLCSLAIGYVLVASLSSHAFAADPDALRHKQQAQEKARALAGELIAAVLDVQLRQLEENGLKSLPV